MDLAGRVERANVANDSASHAEPDSENGSIANTGARTGRPELPV